MNEQEERIRQLALSQAGHDLRGNGTPEQTVERAQVYYEFLTGAAKKSGASTGAG